MCFSATASFVTAGLTGSIGIVSLTRVNAPRELPLALTPILFALQQGIEGLLWLEIPVAPSGWAAGSLTLLYLLFAQVLWPVYAPSAVYLIEPSQGQRRIMLVCLAVGVVVSGCLLWSILTESPGAVVRDYHVVYVTGQRSPMALALAYLVATSLPPLLSSRRTVAALGVLVLLGSIVAYVFYWRELVSVWCFFAAAASVVILCHFERSRRQRLRIADP
jgi:hypothetical protein